MKQKMDELYKKAVAEEGGQVDIWGFAEVDAKTKEAFAKRYPGMSISSRGLQFGTAAAILEANRAGAPTTDSFGGAYTIFWPVWQADLMDRTTDWPQYGLPKEFLDPAVPGMLTTTQNEYVLWYNTSLVKKEEVPTDPFKFLEPKWKDKIASNPSYFFGGFSYVALKFGEEKAVDLAKRLLAEAKLTITADPETLVATGEKQILFPAFGFFEAVRKGAPVAVLPYEGMGTWTQYTGVLKGARHPNGVKLYDLWANFDPDWLETRFKDPAYGIPTTFAGVPGITDRNPKIAAGMEGLGKGYATFLTIDKREERDRLVRVFQALVTRR
jgi:hypothetical protein